MSGAEAQAQAQVVIELVTSQINTSESFQAHTAEPGFQAGHRHSSLCGGTKKMSSFHVDDEMLHKSLVMLVVGDPGRGVCLVIANDGMTVPGLVILKGSTGLCRR